MAVFHHGVPGAAGVVDAVGKAVAKAAVPHDQTIREKGGVVAEIRDPSSGLRLVDPDILDQRAGSPVAFEALVTVVTSGLGAFEIKIANHGVGARSLDATQPLAPV